MQSFITETILPVTYIFVLLVVGYSSHKYVSNHLTLHERQTKCLYCLLHTFMGRYFCTISPILNTVAQNNKQYSYYIAALLFTI